MTDDRQLLERAAKAAGLNVRWYIAGFVHVGSDGLDAGWWNPLTDDGDALRLAVKLGMSVVFGANYVVVRLEQIPTVNNAGDPYAPTRRAIVRAAAAIAPSNGPIGEQRP